MSFKFVIGVVALIVVPLFAQVTPEEAAARLKDREAARLAATTRPANISQAEVDQLRSEVQALHEQIAALKKENASLKAPDTNAPATAATVKAVRKWFFIEGKDRAGRTISDWTYGEFKTDAIRRAKENGILNGRVVREPTRQELSGIIAKLDDAVAHPFVKTEFKNSPDGVRDNANKIAKGMTVEQAKDILGQPGSSEKRGNGSQTLMWRAYNLTTNPNGPSSVRRQVEADVDSAGVIVDFRDFLN
jgi:hypothetical protein